ncbi:hypothetical protein J2S07_000004 [Robertmurraya andreesenii]|uniref:Uncharacterized protein n=1 Tax=Anoxybacillus andreesenii TaxID=1325932 RepID=A0ABT9UYC3_9BACL|nr:hypothetical protein [Robertmurraya andreesenii]
MVFTIIIRSNSGNYGGVLKTFLKYDRTINKPRNIKEMKEWELIERKIRIMLFLGGVVF